MRTLYLLVILPFLFIGSACATPEIHVFIHACTKGNWKQTLTEQLDRLQTSGLYDACDSINIGVLGTKSVNSITRKYPKIKILFQDENMKLFERGTLLNMYHFCTKHPEALVLYLHTKGVTRTKNQNVRHWRRYMEYFLVDRWQDCVTAMTEENYDICGVDWKIEPKPHFSGNFWWTTAKYLLTLPPYINQDYYAPEMWIGQNLPNYRCFHHSGYNLYDTPYTEELYKICL